MQQNQAHQKNLKHFAIIILVVEVIVIVFYGLFVRPQLVANTSTTNQQRYAAYQDVNVMMLIGFGYLMTFIKSHAWSALSYTFFINALVVQLYILWSGFWKRVFHGGWEEQTIFIQETTFTAASYSVASVLIAFGAVLGKVGPKQLILMALIQIIAYTLNEQIVYGIIGMLDVGGSSAIHTFGAYFGLTVSMCLSKVKAPLAAPKSSYTNNIFAMIGTLFLWMFWPSFNYGVFSQTEYQKNLIIANTILALTGSCLSTFMMSAFLGKKFSMQHILNATLAGGVCIGAPAGVSYQPAAALSIGFIIGSISVICYYKIGPKLKQHCGLDDTCGVHNLHGIPGVLGGIFSCFVIFSYTRENLYDPAIANDAHFSVLAKSILGDQYRQGGIQIAGTFISMGIAILFGLITGAIIKCFYHFQANEFYQDEIYFEDAENENLVQKKDRAQIELIARNETLKMDGSRKIQLQPINR